MRLASIGRPENNINMTMSSCSFCRSQGGVVLLSQQLHWSPVGALIWGTFNGYLQEAYLGGRVDDSSGDR